MKCPRARVKNPGCVLIMLKILPCLDSSELAAARKRGLDIPYHVAAELGRSAVEFAEGGQYPGPGPVFRSRTKRLLAPRVGW